MGLWTMIRCGVSKRQSERKSAFVDGNQLWTQHCGMCGRVCVCIPSEIESDVMQGLRNLFPDFFKQVSVGFSRSNAPFRGIWFGAHQPPPTLAMTDSSSDDTQWNVCTVVVFSFPETVSILFHVHSRLSIDCSDFIVSWTCCLMLYFWFNLYLQ